MLKKQPGNMKVLHGNALPMGARNANEEMGKFYVDAGHIPEGLSKTQIKKMKRLRKQSRGGM